MKNTKSWLSTLSRFKLHLETKGVRLTIEIGLPVALLALVWMHSKGL